MKTTTSILKTAALVAGATLLANPARAALETWAGLGNNLPWSTAGNWSPALVPATGDDVVLTNVNGLVIGSTLTNNTVDPGFVSRIRSLKYAQTNCVQRTDIQAPNLTISSTVGTPSPLFVGSGQDDGATPKNHTFIRGKALTINNPSGGMIVRQGSATSGAHYSLLDLSGVDTFTATLQRLLIAYEDDSQNPNRRPGGSLIMAKTNYVTCGYPGLGYQIGYVVQQAASAATNRLGQLNVFNMDSMRFGGAKCLNVTVNFNSGLVNPSATFRNVDGTSRQTTWYIGDDGGTSGSSSSCSAVVNFTGGALDAQVGTLYLGRSQSANTTYNVGGVGTLTFDKGTLDVNSLELGYQIAAGSSAGRGLLNVNGNALIQVNKDLRLARNLGPGTSLLPTNSVGILTINGGTVRVGGNVVDGNVVTTAGLGTTTITITNGGTLDLQPAGDAAPGNVAVANLNIGAGTLTNFSTLSVSNINVLTPASQFTVYPGQTLSPNKVGFAGTLTINTNLVLTNATLSLDAGSSVNSDQITLLGSLTLNGTNSVVVNPLSGFAAGTYTVMTYGAGLTGDVTNSLKLAGAIADSRYDLSFDSNTVPYINLNVSGGPAANLTWSGDGVGNVWNLKGAVNWNGGAGANTEKFYNLDAVSFDDTGSTSPAVNLVGALLPGSVAVNGTSSYTLSGSGKISGSASLAMSSTGTLTVLTTNDYTGQTFINAGTLQVGNGSTADGALGTGDIANYGSLILNSAGSQVIAGALYGTGSIVKRGSGVTQLTGANSFSFALTNEAGTLLAGNPTALGDTFYGTTINSGATLDLGGQNLASEPISVSGTGVGGAGAIINSGPLGGSLYNVALTGSTTFGGAVSWTISPTSTLDGLQANSNNVTKISTNLVSFSNPTTSYTSETGLGNLDVQAGVLSLQGSLGLGDPSKTITIRTNATLEVDNTGDALTSKAIVMDDGACLMSRIPNIALPQYCSVNGPITLGGRNVFDMVSGATVILNQEVGGNGSLVKGVGYHPVSAPTSTGSGLLLLNASNSFTGDLLIQSGTLALTNDASVSMTPNIVLAGATLDVSGRSDGTLTLAGTQTLTGNGTVVGSLNSPSGSTIVPGSSVGTITVSSNVTLRGSTVMEIAQVASVKSGDLLAVGGTLDLGGSLTVTYSGDNLVTGDTFTLFTAGTFANAFTTVDLPVISGVVWTNKTAIDGTIQVLSAPVPPAPEVSGATQLGDGTFQLNFSGPAGYGYSVRATTDVTLPVSSWVVVGTGTFSSSPVSFIDLNAPAYPDRFYVISIP